MLIVIVLHCLLLALDENKEKKKLKGSSEYYNNVLRDIFEEGVDFIKTTLKKEMGLTTVGDLSIRQKMCVLFLLLVLNLLINDGA